jgi:hypothetical protein
MEELRPAIGLPVERETLEVRRKLGANNDAARGGECPLGGRGHSASPA